MRRLVLWFGCCASWMSGAAALAQTQAPATGSHVVSEADDNVARGLFQAGKSAYETGNFKEALQFFEQAYQHSPRPGFLFNSVCRTCCVTRAARTATPRCPAARLPPASVTAPATRATKATARLARTSTNASWRTAAAATPRTTSVRTTWAPTQRARTSTSAPRTTVVAAARRERRAPTMWARPRAASVRAVMGATASAAAAARGSPGTPTR
jgi:thioredoxin-like negative regulator of GroEL